MAHALRTAAVAALVASVLVSTPSGQRSDADVSAPLSIALRQGTAADRHLVWVYFRDKGSASTATVPARGLSQRARDRRTRRAVVSMGMAFEDLPVESRYADAVAGLALRVRHQSRWMNAMSVEAAPSQIEAIAALPFVDRVDIVRRYRRTREEPMTDSPQRAATPGGRLGPRAGSFDYGASLMQLSQLHVPELHQRGLSGDGVVVAVFDSGFPNLQHEVFAGMTIAAERDFVSGRAGVRQSTDSHGTATLSVLGGFHEGDLIGPAFGSTFLLAVTENVRSETPVEEDNWVAAAEWAEALGADVISSSLSYLEFDRPYLSYSDRDMDGETAVSTRAAAMAAARGVVVVVSAGNSGFHPVHNTLGAPADAKRILTVGAVDRDGLRASFSSVGPTVDGRVKPDVAALGVSARVARTGSARSYGFASGTSFSCPLTAGVVALLLQAHPDYTVDDVLLAIRGTAAQSAAPDSLLGWGLVQASAAIDTEIGVIAARRY